MEEIPKTFTVTDEDMQRLKDELAYLTDIRRPEALRDIENAKELGDLAHNSEYDFACEELEKIDALIDELADVMKRTRLG